MAIDFDGSDYADGVNNIVPTSYGTICTWIKPDWSSGSGVNRVIWGAGNDGNNYIRCQHYNDNKWYIGWTVSSTSYRVVIDAASMSVSSGTWYHLAFTWDDINNDSRVYLNGVEKGNNNALQTVGLTGTFYIASYEGLDTWCYGELADFRMYDDELPAEKIKTICAAQGADNIIDSLAFRLLMDDETDGTTAAGAGGVIDISGEGNHYTAQGNPTYRAAPVGCKLRAQL